MHRRERKLEDRTPSSTKAVASTRHARNAGTVAVAVKAHRQMGLDVTKKGAECGA
jgi:hypothetical protein